MAARSLELPVAEAVRGDLLRQQLMHALNGSKRDGGQESGTSSGRGCTWRSLATTAHAGRPGVIDTAVMLDFKDKRRQVTLEVGQAGHVIIGAFHR